MTRRVGRYTKAETTELLRLYDEGFSIYKICRSLNRSQKSIRNNLIRLGKIEGEITPKRLPKNKNKVVETKTSSSEKIISYIIYFLILFLITLTFIIFPEYNLLETILFIIFYS